MVLVYLPYWITRFRIPVGQPLWRILIAGALILVGLIPLLDSIRRFISLERGILMPAVPTEHLVVTGLYRYVRNPMYVGIMTVLIGETVLLYSTAMAEYAVTVVLGVELFVRFYEEPTLRRGIPALLPTGATVVATDGLAESGMPSQESHYC